MDKPRVFVTRRIPQPALDLLAQHAEVTLSPQDEVISRANLELGVRNCDALLCILTDKIDGPLLDLNPKLQIVANYAVGYNNIDVDAATARKIPVTNTPGVLTETTADLAWTLIMDTARRVTEGDRVMRAGKFTGWGPMYMLGSDVTGKTLGIIGMGRIGLAVAKRAQGFDMKILYTKNTPLPSEEEKKYNAHFVDLPTLLKESDIVSIHCPLNEKTKHLIGEKEIHSMKSTAYLINTSRGPVVDEKALVKALQEKRIAGAGLDVFEEEPKMAPGLAELESVVIPPHLGSATLETRTKMGMIAARNIVARLQGQRPPNVVNPTVFG